MERDIRYDIIKGVLIILVVLGHSLNVEFLEDSFNCVLFNIIYCFHMPVFIFISGFFFISCLNRNVKEVFTSKVYRFIIPSLFCSVIILIFYLLIVGFQGLNIRKIISISISYWYLICIFTLTIIYYIALKDWRFTCLRRIFVICIFIGGLIAYDNYPIIQIIDCQSTRMFLCFGAGIMFRSCPSLLKRYFVPLLILAILIIITNRYYYGLNLTYYPPIIRISDGLSWCGIMFTVIYSLASKIKNNFLTKHLINAGQNSLAIYLIHLVLYNATLFFNFPINKGSYISLLYFFLLYSITWSIILICKKYVSNKYNYLIGL